MKKMNRGVTLMELVVASTISLVVILAVGQLDVTRILLSEQVRQSAGPGSEARLAMAQFVRDAQQADRVNVISETDVQLRIPQPCADLACTCTNDVPLPACLDAATAYRWVEYKLADTEIRLYDATGCGINQKFLDIKQPGGFAVEYLDAVAQAPPGGEPFSGSPDDNNVLSITVTTANPSAQEMTYVNTVTLRAGTYTNVNASGGDSGSGLDVQGVSAPPPPCV